MKIQNFKLLVITVFFAGLIVACGGDPNIESAKLNLQNADYEGVITSAELALQENPENADAYYYMGAAYLGMSEDLPLQERPPYLVKTRENMEKAHELYTKQGITSNEAESAIPLLAYHWQNYYVEGVENVNFEGDNEPEVLQTAVYRLKNAIAIAPDSVINYDALAEVHFLSDNMDEAISNMRIAIDKAHDPDEVRYQRIAFFYSIIEEEDELMEVLYEARSNFPEEVYFVQEIANIYLRQGDTEKALEIMNELVEMDPENAEYRLVIGSQIYQAYLQMNSQVNALYDEIFELNQKFRDEARKSQPSIRLLDEYEARMLEKADRIVEINKEQFKIADQAEEHLLISYELEPDNPNTTYVLGAVNENRGIALLDQRNLTEDMDKVNELEKRGLDYFRKALPYYLRTTELEDDPDNWMKLFQVYTRLGMEEEALEAMDKAGL
jgi:tetratricopeptide (TPR) repeat protein